MSKSFSVRKKIQGKNNNKSNKYLNGTIFSTKNLKIFKVSPLYIVRKKHFVKATVLCSQKKLAIIKLACLIDDHLANEKKQRIRNEKKKKR